MPAKAAAIQTREDRASPTTIARVEALDWSAMASGLDAHGCAMTGPLLTAAECAALAALYAEDSRFRSRVVMARHGFGRGEYKYFAYPLPELIAALRDGALSARLPRSPTAGTRPWASTSAIRPSTRIHARCHEAGQRRPTPLLLQYGAGDYNCLHQDLYGEHVFPLQVAILLSQPGRRFHRRRIRADRAAAAHAVARRGRAARARARR